MSAKASLTGHDELPTCVRFTPDDRFVVSAADDRTLRVWDPQRGTCVRILKGHTSMVRAVATLPDNRHVASAGTDGTIRLWDIETGQAKAIAGGRLPHIWTLDAIDGKTVISGDYHRHVKVWDLHASTGYQYILGPANHPGEVRGVVNLPDTDYVAVGCVANEESTAIRVYDRRKAVERGTKQEKSLSNGSEADMGQVWSWVGHGESISDLRALTQKEVVSAGYDKTVRIWKMGMEQAINIVATGDVLPYSAAGWPDGRGVVYGTEEGGLRVWDTRKNKEVLHQECRHLNGVSSVDVSHDGQKIVSAGADKAVRLLVLERREREAA